MNDSVQDAVEVINEAARAGRLQINRDDGRGWLPYSGTPLGNGNQFRIAPKPREFWIESHGEPCVADGCTRHVAHSAPTPFAYRAIRVREVIE